MTLPYKQVANGIYQVRLFLPFALESVNCYLLQDGDGWAIVDSGLNTSQARAQWLATFSGLNISPASITRIILTHSHPDHYGLAGWLQKLARDEGGAEPPVYLSADELGQAERAWRNTEMTIARMAEHFTRSGLAPDVAQTVAAETGKVSARTLPHPQTEIILEAGTVLQIGPRRLEAIHAPGHSDGQLIFYDRADKLLLSGDQVLMKITPHIGTWPGFLPRPLERYLASLAELKKLEVRLALPGHRASITDWPGRLSELQAHHDERLEHTLSAAQNGATVAQVATAVFRLEALNVHETRFALAETLSHLDYLVDRGKLQFEDGPVWRYHQS